MTAEDSLGPLRADLRTLLERTDVRSRRDFGRQVGWDSGEEMIRLFLGSRTGISLEKAARWADLCDAQIRAIPRTDPWVALDQAIEALPDDVHLLKRHLRGLLDSDRPIARARARPRRKRRRAAS